MAVRQNDLGRFAYKSLVVALVGFAVLPLVLIFFVSLTTEPFLSFPPEGLSFKWYAEFMADTEYQTSTRISLIIATGAAVLAGVVGTLSAYALAHADPPGKTVLYALFGSPVLLPPIILGVAFLNLFATLRLTGTYWAVIVSHAVFALPFPFILVTTGLMEINSELTEASMNLGAGPVNTFRKITFPLIKSNIAAGFIFAFVLSLNEFIIAKLVSGFTLVTLPIRIFSSLRYSLTPLIASTSVLMIVLTAVLVITINRLSGGLWE